MKRIFVFTICVLLLQGATLRAAGPTILVMDLESGEIKKTLRFETLTTAIGSPQWSHDGKRLAIDLRPFNKPEWHVYVVDLETLTPTDLGVGDAPSWTPDDKQLAYHGPAEEGSEKVGICIMNVDGKGRQFVSTGSRPRVSPDGEKLAFIDAGEGGNGLYVYDMVESKKTRVAMPDHGSVSYAPAWSSDSLRLACLAKAKNGGAMELCVVGAKEGSPAPVCVFRGNVTSQLSWDPSKEIYFSAQDEGETIYKLRRIVATGEAGKPDVLKSQDVGNKNQDPALSPDGKRVAFVSDRQ